VTGTVFGKRGAGLSTLPFGRGADVHVARLASDAASQLPIERYAAVRAALWREPGRSDEILAQHGLDRISWHCYEARTLSAASDEARLARLFDALRERTKKR
jgi:hypothetical protein